MKCEMWNVKCEMELCHPERSAKREVEGSRTRIILPLLISAFAILAPLSFAQQNSDIDAVKQRAALNSAKADLEEARKKREWLLPPAGKTVKRQTRNANFSTKSTTRARKRSMP